MVPSGGLGGGAKQFANDIEAPGRGQLQPSLPPRLLLGILIPHNALLQRGETLVGAYSNLLKVKIPQETQIL